MSTQIFRLRANKVKAAVAVISAAAVLWAANPALARLDELIIEGAPYVSPPAVTQPAPQIHYEVRIGDTLSDIAWKNGLSIETLAVANGLHDRDKIKAGQVLKLPADGALHLVQRGETLSDIARLYRADARLIASRNGLSDMDKIIAGQQIIIPGSGLVAETLSAGSLSAWSLSWPLVGRVTSTFGIRDGKPHEGIDIAAETGAPIKAAAPGRVVFAGPRGTYGLAIIIDHGDGVRTLYAHCSKILVSEGSTVGSSTVIALAGNTGRSTGPHLHMEVLKNGVPLDPLHYLEQEIYYG